MEPGLFDKLKSKFKGKLRGSGSEDELASKQPLTAPSTAPAHASSSSAAPSTTSTTTTATIVQPDATSTTQSTASSTGRPTASSSASSVKPRSNTARLQTHATVQPVVSQPTQPSAAPTVQSTAPSAPQPVTCPPTQPITSPPPPTTATPSASQSLPEQLWKRAYKSLKEKELPRVQAYEEILSKFQKEWADTATSPTVPDLEHCKSAESADMWKLVYAGLDKSKKQAEFKEAVADVLGTVEKIKGIVDKAVKYSPEASTIWAGASLGLEILANPVKEPGINRKGIAYVLTRIEWYWNLADVVLNKDMASPSSADLRKNLENHVVELYKKLLLFQMRSVCLYDRNGISVVLRDSIQLDDWTDQIKDVKDAEALVQKDLDQFTDQDMRAKLKEMRDTAWSQEKAFRDEVRRLQKREQHKDDQECLVDLLLTDPQKDKERIQTIKGNPLWDSYHWILEHSGYDKFTNEPSSRVLWIKGDPGKGKTMLICGIIDQLDKSTDPLSYFFCQATEKDQSSDTAVMRGLIYMILDHYPSLMAKLRVEYDKKKKKLFDSPNTSLLLDDVLTDMLQDPILKDAVFIIDALDECKMGRSNLVKLIVKLSSSCHAKWIVSSRDWPEIQREFRGIQGLVPITLEENKKKVAEAVQSYIRAKVDKLAENWDDDDNNDGKDKKKDLKGTVYNYMASHAEDTFLWVALVCQRLAESDVGEHQILEELEKFPKGLPELYNLMMDRALASSESDRLKAVLAAACVAYGHLKSNEMIDFVKSMAGYNERAVRETIGACGSFLTYQDGVIYFVHQSAKEYLLKEGSGHIFPHGVEHQHLQIASRCLDILKGGLRENICGLSSYGTLIGEFTRQSPDPLSPLEYSCLYWAEHVVASAACGMDVNIVGKVFQFLQDKLTYWLEALSLLGQLPVAAKGIVGIESALGAADAKGLLEFLQDARRFVRYHIPAIEIAPRQVYASALVFSPRCSKVRQRFQKQIPNWIASKPEMQDGWDMCIQTISLSFAVNSVACSPDGRLFAAACGEEARVYDATSSECVYTLRLTPYKPMTCVTFSSCSSKLAAACSDQVRILQVDTFECIQTIEDHNIYIVLFSPDGELLVTVGSIRAHVWNWKARRQVHNLNSNSSVIPSATFLSGDKLVTASSDGTAKVWDLTTGNCEQTLGGHDSRIGSIACSPDGKRLATGTMQQTAKVWHQTADTGEWVCHRTLPHKQGVQAVSFSADSCVLITGADDGYIRLWDEAGVCIKTINTHGSPMKCLSSFPKGQQLLACSWGGRKITIWDISTSSAGSPREARLPSPDQDSAGPDDDYIGRIINLAFSPDGRSLVSHAGNGKTKVWNLGTGSYVLAQETSDSHKPFFKTPIIASTWLAYPNGGERAVMRSTKGETVVWDLIENKRLDVPSRKVVYLFAPKFFGQEVVIYSPDAKLYAFSSFVEPCKVFSVVTGKCVYTTSSRLDTALTFSPDSQGLFACSRPGIQPYGIEDVVFYPLGLGQARDSTGDTCMNTQFGILETSGFDETTGIKRVGWGLSFDRDWILRGNERMLFVPAEHRKLVVDAVRKRFAIVCPWGRIVTMELA